MNISNEKQLVSHMIWHMDPQYYTLPGFTMRKTTSTFSWISHIQNQQRNSKTRFSKDHTQYHLCGQSRSNNVTFPYILGSSDGDMFKTCPNPHVEQLPSPFLQHFIWLVVSTPLKTLVNWDDYSQYMETQKMFQTTNQLSSSCAKKLPPKI